MPNPLAAESARFPFDTILIANRGEIAVRVIRACRDLGLRSVAVYSDADRLATHVRLADDAVHIGPAMASASYLNIERIIAAARASRRGRDPSRLRLSFGKRRIRARLRRCWHRLHRAARLGANGAG